MNARKYWRKLFSLLYRSCNCYLSLKPASARSPIEMLRSATSTHFLYSQKAFIRIPVKVLACISWPFAAIRLSYRHHALFGKIAKQQSGKGPLRQFASLLYLAWFEFVHPRYYYLFHLFDQSRMQRRGAYLFQRNSGSLFLALNKFASGELINNKIKFVDFCQANSLPAPRTLALFAHGNMEIKVAPEFWVGKDLVVKPVAGNAGRDVRFAFAQEIGDYRYGEKSFAINELLNCIAAESGEEHLLMQERLFNHPDISLLANEFLASIRIVSFLGQENAPTLLAAYVGIPHDSITVSNAGVCFPLDLQTGKILPRPVLPLMPEQRELIKASVATGWVIPHWLDAKALVLAAHRLLPDYFSLGWDIAITESGPVILETNIGWDTDSLQLFHDLPLGETEFARCAVERLGRPKAELSVKRHYGEFQL